VDDIQFFSITVFHRMPTVQTSIREQNRTQFTKPIILFVYIIYYLHVFSVFLYFTYLDVAVVSY